MHPTFQAAAAFQHDADSIPAKSAAGPSPRTGLSHYGWLDQTGRPALLMAAVFAGLFALALYVLGYVAQVPDELLIPGVLLASLLGLLAVKAATGAAYRARANARGLLDACTGLYNAIGFASCGDAMLREARDGGRAMSLAVFDFSDLEEVRTIYGSKVSRKVMAHVVRKLEKMAGAGGLAARTGRTQFAVLLPGLGRKQAEAAMARAFGDPCCVEFDAGDSEIVLVPDVLAAAFKADTASVTHFQRDLGRELARSRDEEQRRRYYLQRERERHSRPMSLHAADGSKPAPRTVYRAPMAQTMPAELASA